MTTIEQLAAERDRTATALTAANRAVKDAEMALLAATRDYNAACVAFAKLEPQRFEAGAKVKRAAVRHPTYSPWDRAASKPAKTVWVRGVVTLCEGVSNYRNHYPKPGEWFVLSASGQTAYSLRGDWLADTE